MYIHTYADIHTYVDTYICIYIHMHYMQDLSISYPIHVRWNMSTAATPMESLTSWGDYCDLGPMWTHGNAFP